ncbi:16S rRNA (cytidine(1402)-2'-O)-methyltransferase [bacterium]|nr:16S rRNA (cytidine(1402)-2'-O)-methyltransferase [bacterium]
MSDSGRLTLVATPIGNLGDISPRAVQTLSEADLIAAEDTRHTGRLLSHLGIKKPMVAYYDANEAHRAGRIIEACLAGQAVALVCSAGHPAISDPGYVVVREAVAAGVTVSVIPGPCAAVSALSVSGLPTDAFCFHGFPPRKGPDRKALFTRISSGGTHILYESPKRIVATLEDIGLAADDPQVAVIRELTKKFEEVLRGSASDVASELASRGEVLGEIVLIVHTPTPDGATLDAETLARIQRMQSEAGLSNKDAAKAAAALLGISRKEIYDALAGK